MSLEKKRSLRESATLIVAARNNNANVAYDYSVLLMKRTEETAYLRDHCVFPGGVFDAEDENVEWLKYFCEFGVTKAQLDALLISDLKRPQIFKNTNSGCPKDISLRITALRETFEEVGLLLCRNRNNIQKTEGFGTEYQLNDAEKQHWQSLVYKDSKQFLNLCKQLNVVPDLWSLQEWSVWRSPTSATKRYDTVFYFVALEKIPCLLIEKTEVADVMWKTPAMFLKIYSERTIWLPPLHYYEFSRLTHIFNIEHLSNFSIKRNSKGSTLLMPVYYRCKDGLVGLLPGDDLYPDNPENHIESTVVENNINEFNSAVKRRHRIYYYDIYNMQVELTIKPIDDHLSPIKICDNSKL